MAKTIFEEMGGTYTQIGDYFLPDLKLPEEETKPIGVWGQQHLYCLKQYRKVLYTNLLTSGKLNSYLADIDKQAEKRFDLLTEQMKQTQGITEQLKAENTLEWAGLMNNIRACAMWRLQIMKLYMYKKTAARKGLAAVNLIIIVIRPTGNKMQISSFHIHYHIIAHTH